MRKRLPIKFDYFDYLMKNVINNICIQINIL